jgi:hypothetical protein
MSQRGGGEEQLPCQGEAPDHEDLPRIILNSVNFRHTHTHTHTQISAIFTTQSEFKYRKHENTVALHYYQDQRISKSESSIEMHNVGFSRGYDLTTRIAQHVV